MGLSVAIEHTHTHSHARRFARTPMHAGTHTHTHTCAQSSNRSAKSGNQKANLPFAMESEFGPFFLSNFRPDSQRLPKGWDGTRFCFFFSARGSEPASTAMRFGYCTLLPRRNAASPSLPRLTCLANQVKQETEKKHKLQYIEAYHVLISFTDLTCMIPSSGLPPAGRSLSWLVSQGSQVTMTYSRPLCAVVQSPCSEVGVSCKPQER